MDLSPIIGIRCELWNIKFKKQKYKKKYKNTIKKYKKSTKHMDLAAHVWAGQVDTAERCFSPVIGIQSDMKYVTWYIP